MLIVGIDPGVFGGIASLHMQTGELKCVAMMPLDPTVDAESADKRVCVNSLLSLFQGFRVDRLAVYIEDIFCGPVMSRKSFLNMAQNHGRILAVLESLFIPYVLVPPVTWQASLFRRVKKKDKDGNRYKSKVLAASVFAQHFPEMRKPETINAKSWEGIIDASLIALYGFELFTLEKTQVSELMA